MLECNVSATDSYMHVVGVDLTVWILKLTLLYLINYP
jgi:hypothetical protein